MKLVVGLGNPGPEYSGNRHNVGFMMVDELLRRANETTVTKFKGQMARASVGRENAILLKPMTYMNNSGVSVGMCAGFYNIEAEDTLVVYDDLDLDFGSLRMKESGGHGGHNGLRSIFSHFSPGEFPRLRIGIGRPQHGTPAKHVLSNFTTDERIELSRIVSSAADAVEMWAREGATVTMNEFNRRQSLENTEH
jgi:PTH1 family peptidyl-tRNA hydrolase